METFHDELQSLMSVVQPPETGNSFTALLELPPNQAVMLLHSPNQMEIVKHEQLDCDSIRNSSPNRSDPKSTKRKEREKNVCVRLLLYSQFIHHLCVYDILIAICNMSVDLI